MKKHPIFICLFMSAIMLCGGISLAYYNTKTFGFDENASVVTVYPSSVKVMDYNIKYSEIEKLYKKVKKYLPDESITVKCHNTMDSVVNNRT